MMGTADSSLIVALYLNEADSVCADAACASVTPPIRITDWHRVEISNAFQRAVKNSRITAAQGALLWQDFTADVAAGRFVIVPIDHAAVLDRTLSLTQKHTAVVGTRSLDLIHIASALEMGATDFLSFDHRQRQTASSEGLNVVP
jgi:predicted nucleic acid-binding protein